MGLGTWAGLGGRGIPFKCSLPPLTSGADSKRETSVVCKCQKAQHVLQNLQTTFSPDYFTIKGKLMPFNNILLMKHSVVNHLKFWKILHKTGKTH